MMALRHLFTSAAAVALITLVITLSGCANSPRQTFSESARATGAPGSESVKLFIGRGTFDVEINGRVQKIYGIGNTGETRDGLPTWVLTVTGSPDAATNAMLVSGDGDLLNLINKAIAPVPGLYGARVRYEIEGIKSSQVFGWDFNRDGSRSAFVQVTGKNGTEEVARHPILTETEWKAQVEKVRGLLSADFVKDSWFARGRIAPENLKPLLDMQPSWIATKNFQYEPTSFPGIYRETDLSNGEWNFLDANGNRISPVAEKGSVPALKSRDGKSQVSYDKKYVLVGTDKATYEVFVKGGAIVASKRGVRPGS